MNKKWSHVFCWNDIWGECKNERMCFKLAFCSVEWPTWSTLLALDVKKPRLLSDSMEPVSLTVFINVPWGSLSDAMVLVDTIVVMVMLFGFSLSFSSESVTDEKTFLEFFTEKRLLIGNSTSKNIFHILSVSWNFWSRHETFAELLSLTEVETQ